MEELKTWIKLEIASYFDNMGNFSSTSFVYGAMDALQDVLDKIEEIQKKGDK